MPFADRDGFDRRFSHREQSDRKMFYERGCQEKIFPLTRRPGLFLDSQPRDIGGPCSRGQ